LKKFLLYGTEIRHYTTNSEASKDLAPLHFHSYFCGGKEQTKGVEGAAKIPMGTNCFREKEYMFPKHTSILKPCALFMKKLTVMLGDFDV